MFVNKAVPGTNTGTEVGNRNASTAQKERGLLEDSAQCKIQCSYYITMEWSYDSDLFKLTLHMLS